MWTTYLTKKRGMYKALSFINFLAILIAPFINSHLFVVDEGGGTAGEQEKKEAEEKMFKAIETKIKALISDSQKDVYSKKDLDSKVEKLNKEIADKLDSEGMKKLNDSVTSILAKQEELSKSLVDQGIALKKIQEGNVMGVRQNFLQAAKASILKHKDTCLEEITDSNGTRLSLLKYFKSGNKLTPEFEIEDGTSLISKAAVDMLESNIVQNYVSTIRLSELISGVYGTPLTIYPHVLDYFPQRNINKPNMSMLVTYTYVDGAGTKTEGSAGSKSSFLLKTVSFPAFFIDTYIPLSDETLDDIEEVLSEINRLAPDKIKDSLDSKIYADSGNDTSDIMGMFVNGSKCTDFVPATYENSVVGANDIDTIEAMIASCETNKYMPDTVGLNPTDIRNKFNSLKNALNDSVKDNRVVFVNGNLVSICGLRVIRSTAIAANSCFVGAINKVALLGIRKAMSMEIGLNGTDFTERQKTARIGMRVAFGVGDPLGIIYCSNMSSALETIDGSPID